MQYDPSSPEWQLLQKTADNVVSRVHEDGLNALTPDERIFFLVWIAEAEVGNGGMHAVCYNSTGNFLPKLPSAFAEIGAVKKAALFSRLISAFGRESPSENHEERLVQHEALPDSAVEEIDSLDEAYFASEHVEHTLHMLAQKIRNARVDV